MRLREVENRTENAGLSLPEAAFRFGASRRLAIDADAHDASHLARKVAAFPRDLLSHTRRVLLARQQHNTEELFGALVDLFIATGPKGVDLRRNLLATSAELLPPIRLKYLQANLTGGLSTHSKVACAASVLTSGNIGTTKLIVRSGSN